MRRLVAVCLTLAGFVLLLTGVSAGDGSAVRLTVTPAVGHPGTRFVVTFIAPQTTRRGNPPESGYDLSATSGCGQGVGDEPAPTRAGQRVRLILVPAAAGRKPWCLGTVHGRLRFWHLRRCQPSCAGPAYRTLARFSFRVVALGTDITPPAFAGIQSAFACTPGPQRPGETTPFTLTWQAASDNITPASEIVYDVFMSTTSGGEDFSHPNWTTMPGVTTFKTPGLASHGTFYFVVRARDQAGNEDPNKVERRGIDPCV